MNGRAAAAVPADVGLRGIPAEQTLHWLRMMILIRSFESTAEPLAAQGLIPGGMHSAIGQEATAVGIISALRAADIVTGTHRSHHITLAKGLPPAEVMAELFGKATGSVHGRGGHMHLADVARGHFGSNGIVGAGLGIALGAALAASVRETGQIAVGFFGDGGANVGRVWEFVNLAVIWQLPLIVVCENNLYAVETPFADVTGGGDITRRAAGFGITACTVDGQDVAAVHHAASTAAERARSGQGPSFIQSLTYRHGGHDVGDRETYRTREEVDQWRTERDPISALTGKMIAAGHAEQTEVDALWAHAQHIIDEAVEFAQRSPVPDLDQLGTDVTATEMKIRGNR